MDKRIEQGLELLKANNVDDSIAYFQNLLGDHYEINDLTKEILYILGDLYFQKGLLGQAEEAFGRIVEEDFLYKDVKEKLFSVVETKKQQESKSSRYNLIEEIGRGGMGIVYKATDSELNRVVVLKTIKPELIPDFNTVERFINEARIAASLNHPGIVKIFDVGDYDKTKYICMEYVDGTSLRKIIESEKKPDFSDLLRIALDICEPLSYAHEKGVIHRDIKPDNILLNQESLVKITDFGIAKILNVQSLTRDGFTWGTFAYMAPEQIAGEAADERADIYSFGITLYEAATGSLPFSGENELLRDSNSALKPIQDAPSEFSKLIFRCLAKDKTERCSNFKEIAEVLEKLV